jgi:hypothetical protein
MPTVLRWRGFRFVIYPNDHAPAHIHFIGPENEAVFVLNCPDGPPNLRESYNASTSLLNDAAGVIMEHLADFCDRWAAIHGDF